MTRLPIALPPSRPYMAASRAIWRHATPVAEYAGKIFTIAAVALAVALILS
jgi:hypothetical protein